MERRAIRWRAEHEKTGHEHRTPVTADPLDAKTPMSPPGLEPGAYCLGGSRSIHLSYGDCLNLQESAARCLSFMYVNWKRNGPLGTPRWPS